MTEVLMARLIDILTGFVTGPGSSTSGHFARWNNTSGTLLSDGVIAPADMPLFASGTSGTVPASGGGTVNFLRADGTWTNPSFPTVAANSILGNNTGGATTPISLTGAQVTAMLSLFASGTQGLVPASGGGTANFLRADGSFATPGVFTPTLAGYAPASGGGTVNFLRADGTWASPEQGSPIFSAVQGGDVPASGGGTTNYLRADGTWSIPSASIPSAAGSSGQIQWNNSGSLAGFTASGDATIVPSTGVVTVTKTSGVAFAASATTDTTNASNITSGSLLLTRLQTIAALSVLGNPTGSSAVPVAIGNPQYTLLLSQFTNVAQGVVPASGGGTVNFLRADGTWAPAAAGTSLAINSTPITGGTTQRLLYDNAGVVGELILGTNLSISSGTLNATGGGGTPGGATTNVQFNNSGAFGGDAGFTYAGNGQVTIALGTITANAKALNITGTWNASGVTFDAPLFVNITNTASAAGSLLADLQVGGTSVFTVDKNGSTVFGHLTAAFVNNLQVNGGTNAGGSTDLVNIVFNNSGSTSFKTQFSLGGGGVGQWAIFNDISGNKGDNFGIYHAGSTTVPLGIVGSSTKSVTVSNGWTLGFAPTFNAGTVAVPDVFMFRAAAAVLQHGAPDAAAPVAQTIQFQNVVGGTSNTSGANTTFIGSLSTGTGTPGDIIFQTGIIGTTGTTQVAPVEVCRIAHGRNGQPTGSFFVGQTGDRLIGGFPAYFSTAGNGLLSSGNTFISYNTSASNGSCPITMVATRATTPLGRAAMVSGDPIPGIFFNGDDGTNDTTGCSITVTVAGTVSTNHMPAYMQFTASTAAAASNVLAIGAGTDFSANLIPSGGGILRIYNTLDQLIGLTNYERAALDWTTNSGTFTIATQKGGTGLSRNINIAPSSAITQFGNADAAAPVAQSLTVQNVLAGTSNTAAANTNIYGSQSTGTGLSGNISFNTGFQGVTQTSATVTLTIASPCVVSLALHQLVTGQAVQLATTGALPTGLTAGTTYYVISNFTLGNGTFQLATSAANALAGIAINTSGSQSGTQTLSTVNTAQNTASPLVTLGPSTLTGSQTAAGMTITQNVNNNVSGASLGTLVINQNQITLPSQNLLTVFACQINGTNVYTIDGEGRMLIGLTATQIPIAGGTGLIEVANNVNSNFWNLSLLGYGGGGGGAMNLIATRGALGSHTAMQNGDGVGNIYCYADDGSNQIDVGRMIGMNVDQVFTSGGGHVPTRTVFETASISGHVERLRIDSNGNMVFGYTGQPSAIGGTYTALTAANTVTISIASPAVITLANHGYVPGQAVVFTTTGALPTGITSGTVYYVIAAGLASGSFEIAATPQGAAINTSGSQSGTQTCTGQNAAATIYASPLVTFGPSGVTGALTTAGVTIAQTWNTTGAVDATLLVNAVNIASSVNARVFDAQIGGTSVLNVDSQQTVNIGGFNNQAFGGSKNVLQIVGTSSSFNGTTQITASADGGAMGSFQLKTRGTTPSTQTIVQVTDTLGILGFAGSDGAAYQNAAQIICLVDAAPAAGSMPGSLIFATTPSGTTSVVNRLKIDNAGNCAVVGGTLGYGTGVGGTVTQATSRTTGVTLNKICGQITMFSAAGSATAATFTVTNSKVAATDTIILNQASGTNLYELFVTAVAAGSFNITFFTTGGVATDAPVINFSVIKAVTA